MATRYLFYSHDGYGLGHARRNSLIGRAVLDADPTARVTLVTGLRVRPPWLGSSGRIRVHRVPSLIKDADGTYRHETLTFEEAVARREQIVTRLIERERPHVVVVDRVVVVAEYDYHEDGQHLVLYEINLAHEEPNEPSETMPPDIEKRRIVDLAELGVGLTAFQGITRGPDLSDGTPTLILASDNEFGGADGTIDTTFVLLALDGA